MYLQYVCFNISLWGANIANISISLNMHAVRKYPLCIENICNIFIWLLPNEFQLITKNLIKKTCFNLKTYMLTEIKWSKWKICMPSKNMYSVWKIYANGKYYANWKKIYTQIEKNIYANRK